MEMISLIDYKPWEFESEDVPEFGNEWFNQLKEKYKTQRAAILPKNKWQPLIDKWLQDYPDPNMWFVLHVKKTENADLYRAALKRKGFTFREVDNKYYDTPIYLETPLNGLNVDQNDLLDVVSNMENRGGVLYYRNIPAPVIDLLYKEVFEEHLVYPERFD